MSESNPFSSADAGKQLLAAGKHLLWEAAQVKNLEKRLEILSQALERFDDLSDAFPDFSFDAKFGRGMALELMAVSLEPLSDKLDHFYQALDCYKEAHHHKPGSPHPFQHSGGCYVAMALLTEDCESKEKLYEVAVRFYGMAATRSPQRGKGYLNGAKALRAWGRIVTDQEVKVSLCRRTLEQMAMAAEFESLPARDWMLWSQDLSMLSTLLSNPEKSSLLDDALGKARAAMAMDPSSAIYARQASGIVSAKAKTSKGEKRRIRLLEAQAAWRHAVDLMPDHAAAQHSLGSTSFSLAEISPGEDQPQLYRAAALCFERAAALAPRYHGHFSLLGQSLSGQGRFAAGDERRDLFLAAFDCYRKADELKPGMEAIQIMWARDLLELARGSADEIRGELHEQAAQRYLAAAECCPQKAAEYRHRAEQLRAG